MEKKITKLDKIIKIMDSIVDYDDDVKQDVLLKIIKNVNFQDYPEQTLLNLTRKMLRNRKIDLTRKKTFDIIEEDCSEVRLINQIAQETYEEGFDIDKATKDLYLALKSLGGEQQKVIALVLEGKKNEMIAKELNMTLGAVKSSKRNSIIKLKKILNNE